MTRSLKFVLAAGVAAAGAASAQPAQKITGPIATYWLSTQTQTGFGMPGGGGRPSPGEIMQMMRGGAGAQHLMRLELGSSERPNGDPSADHDPPAGLGVGPSLPLVTPREVQSQPEEQQPGVPHQFERPHGRMLIFWGCGEHARPGQPVVIDFAQVSAGQIPPALQAAMRGLSITPERGPAPGRDTTYGAWPNERSSPPIPASGSLVGEHLVRGDYSPEIRFTLSPDQDFLAPLRLTSNARIASGAVQLGWDAVPNAQAYLATAVGGGQDTVVLWSSSEVQASAFAAPEYLSPHDIGRLLESHVLLSPQTTACAVPKEVNEAAPHAMVQLVAYGPEANFVYPPRPRDPKVPWNRQWAVKVRYRSSTGGLLGQSMPGMAADGPAPGEGPRPEPPKTQRPSILRGLGGVLGVPFPPRP